MGGIDFYSSFIIKVDCLFHFTECVNRDTFLVLVFSPLSIDLFWLLQSWIIFLTWGTLYRILRMSSLFLHSINRTRKSHYNTTIKKKCDTPSNLKLLLLCSFLFQVLSKIDIRKYRLQNLKEVYLSMLYRRFI